MLFNLLLSHITHCVDLVIFAQECLPKRVALGTSRAHCMAKSTVINSSSCGWMLNSYFASLSRKESCVGVVNIPVAISVCGIF